MNANLLLVAALAEVNMLVNHLYWHFFERFGWWALSCQFISCTWIKLKVIKTLKLSQHLCRTTLNGSDSCFFTCSPAAPCCTPPSLSWTNTSENNVSHHTAQKAQTGSTVPWRCDFSPSHHADGGFLSSYILILNIVYFNKFASGWITVKVN